VHAAHHDLSARIFDAFASRPRPPDDRILRPDASPDADDRLRVLLAAETRDELTEYELRTIVEGNLWMLTPEVFLYFLPAFLKAALESYASLGMFASELVDALTEPSRADVEEALDRAAEPLALCGHSRDMIERLRKQQLAWFDSGAPTATFRGRFGGLTWAEGAAILAFFVAFEAAHGADFPLGELTGAVDRYWGRYRSPPSGC
jgi:hypothetical protein